MIFLGIDNLTGLHNIDILGIQEHRIVHKEPVKFENIQGQTLITTSATRNIAGASIGGVGRVLSANTKASLAGVVPHTERILVANFQGNPATTVIVTYCPTNVEDEDKIEDDYDNLRRAIDSINQCHDGYRRFQWQNWTRGCKVHLS
ncbi:uncharacterized protein [Amphiura filiformis]|uniref:uncharacterized protein n=1 Tax=Amphiura filiformis TaxID=82378 RepID=UPI003B217AE3